LTLDFLNAAVFNSRSDPGPFRLTTPGANNGVLPPVVHLQGLPDGRLNVTVTSTGPPNSTVTTEFAGMNYYRSGNGFGGAVLTPTGIPDLNTVLDGQGQGQSSVSLTRQEMARWIVLSALNKMPNGDTTEYSVPAKVPRGINDFDGDGRTDLSVVRPGQGNAENVWYSFISRLNEIRIQQFGLGDDKVVSRDYQGDQKADFAVWRPSNQTLYHSRLNGDPATNFNAIRWGVSGDVPVVGDFDNDGVGDVVVYRPPQGTWFIRRSIDGGMTAQQWGLATDKLVAADYDGDGDTDIGVYRGGTWYISVCPQCPPIIRTFGIATDIPVPGDYDGDGIDDIAVWRESDGVWWILQSRTGAVAAAQWGTTGDKPLKGDWDGDGKNDLAIWRASAGDWYILQSSNLSMLYAHWGLSGDVPVGAF
jgi:hypothetical protein